jgi:uncharacterized coiled-coil protein SlyX
MASEVLPFVAAADRGILSGPQAPDAGRAIPPPEREGQLRVLALSLLDLCAACETELHTVTTMQRSLERARRMECCPAEAELLIGELSRQLTALEQSRTEGIERLRAVRDQLNGVQAAISSIVL